MLEQKILAFRRSVFVTQYIAFSEEAEVEEYGNEEP